MDLVDKANKLAAEHRLSRETNNVGFDKHSNLFWASETISQEVEGGEVRKETYFQPVILGDPEKFALKILVTKAIATLQFLGEPTGLIEEHQEKVAAKKAKKKAEPEPEIKKPDPVEKDEKAKPAAKKKVATTKKANPKKKDSGGDDVPAKEKSDPIIYNKASRDHAAFARDIVAKELGEDWKKVKEKAEVVKKLVAALVDNKVAVLDKENSENCLDSFKVFVTAFLNNNYKPVGDEDEGLL